MTTAVVVQDDSNEEPAVIMTPAHDTKTSWCICHSEEPPSFVILKSGSDEESQAHRRKERSFAALRMTTAVCVLYFCNTCCGSMAKPPHPNGTGGWLQGVMPVLIALDTGYLTHHLHGRPFLVCMLLWNHA